MPAHSLAGTRGHFAISADLRWEHPAPNHSVFLPLALSALGRATAPGTEDKRRASCCLPPSAGCYSVEKRTDRFGSVRFVLRKPRRRLSLLPSHCSLGVGRCPSGTCGRCVPQPLPSPRWSGHPGGGPGFSEPSRTGRGAGGRSSRSCSCCRGGAAETAGGAAAGGAAGIAAAPRPLRRFFAELQGFAVLQKRMERREVRGQGRSGGSPE